MSAEPSSTTSENAPALRPLGSHARSPAMPLTRLLTLVGADPRCHLHLVSSTVSRQHALIVAGDGQAYVRDLASRTKVLLNHEEVREAGLNDGDEIQIGKFAFQFVAAPGPASQSAAPAPAALTISERAAPLAIAGRTVLIGRDPECDISIDHPSVSARHAVIFHIGGKRHVRDLNSRTGTFLNGSRVRQQEVLFGDQIRIGETRLELTAARSAAKAAPAPAVAKAAPARPLAAPVPVLGPRPAAPVAAKVVAPPPVEVGIPEELVVEPLPPLEVEESIAVAPAPPAPPPPAAKGPPKMVMPPVAKVEPPAVVKVAEEPIEEELPPLQIAEPEEPVVVAPSAAPKIVPPRIVPPPIVKIEPPVPVKVVEEPVEVALSPLELAVPDEPVVVAPAVPPRRVVPPAAAKVEAPAPLKVVDEPVEEALPPLEIAEPEVEEPAVAAAPPPPLILGPRRFVLPPVAKVESPAPVEVVEEPTEESLPPMEVVEAEEPVVVAPPPPAAAPVAPPRRVLPPATNVELPAEDVPVDLEPVEEIAPLSLEPEQPVLPAAEEEVVEEPIGISFEPREVAEPEAHSEPELPPQVVSATIDELIGAIEIEEIESVAGKIEPAPEPAASESPITGLNLDVEDFPEVAAAAEPEVSAGAGDEVLEAPASGGEATLDLDSALPAAPAAEVGDLSRGATENPSDTEFGKLVEQFSGESTGPLVEESQFIGASEAQTIEPETREIPLRATTDEISIAPAEAKIGFVIDSPAPAPIRPALPPATVTSDSFSLDDGFFSADLTANGIFIREGGKPIGQASPIVPMQPAAPRMERPAPMAPAAPATPAPPSVPVAPAAPVKPVAPAVTGWNSTPETIGTESYFGGMPVDLAQPKKPAGKPAQISVAFDPKPHAGEKAGRAARQPGDVDIPQPPPKARSKRATPFATKSMGISPEEDEPPARPSKGAGDNIIRGLSTAFDGLAMPPRDVFSEFEATASNDAAFGGVRLSRGDDYVLPESPEVAARLSNTPDHDFAEDDFWNRTDEEEGALPTGGGVGPSRMEPPAAEPVEAEPQSLEPTEIEPPTNGEAPRAEAAQPEAGLEEISLEDAPTPVVEPEPEPAALEEPAPPEVEPPPVETPTPVEVVRKTKRVAPPVAAAPVKDESEETWADIPVAAAAPADEPATEEARIVEEPPAAVQPPPKAPRRAVSRTRVLPILMLTMLLCMGIVLAGIWLLIRPKSHVVGTLTYVNFDWVPGTDDGAQFEASQRRILESDETHGHAREVLAQRFPGTTPGFLDTDAAGYLRIVSGVKLSSSPMNGQSQTMLQLTADGADKNRDEQRMGALLQAVYDANAATVDDNRRIREIATGANQEVDDANQRIVEIKAQMPSLQRVIDQNPDPAEFAALTLRKQQLQKARFDAEDVLDQDREGLERLQAAGAQTAADPPQQQAAPDPQLEALRQQILALNKQLQDAKDQQSAGVAEARSQLEQAVQQFNDQLSASDGVLDSGSQLRQFVDSAKDSQLKARQMITTLIVDGEDLQRQLEDTRRDVEEMIQSRQEEKWAGDPQLQELQTSLDGAQHRYNAAVGEGVGDQQLLDSLKKEIDDLTAQVKARKDALGVDPGEVKVADGLNKVIESQRRKLEKEKQQIDDVLDPLEQQLASLDGQVGSLPEAQQQMAQQLRQSLSGLNEARKNYAQMLGEGESAPSAKVTDLEKQVDDLKSRFDRRQADLAQQQPQQDASQLVEAQNQFKLDKDGLEETKKAYDAVRVQYDDEAGRREDAQAAQAQMEELTEELNNRSSELEVAVRDRDQKQLQADRCFDIRPPTDADVLATSVDPRQVYSLYAMGGLAVLFTLLTIAASRRAAERRPGRGAGKMGPATNQQDADDDRHALPA